MDFKRNIVITGGAGFIGNHVVRLFVNKYPDCRIINLDKLTYAGNLANLKDVEQKPNYVFVKADICDYGSMQEVMRQYRVAGIIPLAAESHVDRSIKDPFIFARTNVLGTLTLLQAAKEYWESLPEGYEERKTPFLPIRCMGKNSSMSTRNTTRIRLIRQARPAATILCVRSMTLTACRPSSPIARTITVLTSSRRN